MGARLELLGEIYIYTGIHLVPSYPMPIFHILKLVFYKQSIHEGHALIWYPKTSNFTPTIKVEI
ncbi:hypothetical protein E2320_006897 [Naja naja]|nr:hypothetical protein E2320_006897 [Naja naja]